MIEFLINSTKKKLKIKFQLKRNMKIVSFVLFVDEKEFAIRKLKGHERKTIFILVWIDFKNEIRDD